MVESEALMSKKDYYDARGVPVSYPNMDAIDGLERAVILSLSFRGDPVAEIEKTLEEHPVDGGDLCTESHRHTT